MERTNSYKQTTKLSVLRINTNFSQIIKKKKKEYFLIHSIRSVLSDTKFRQRKLQKNIPYDYSCKNKILTK